MKKSMLFLLALLLVAALMLPAYATDGEQAAPADDTVLKVAVCLLIGLAAGITVALLMKRSMSTVRKQQRADSYVREDSFSLTEARDLFLYSTVTRVRINNSNNNRK